MTYREMKQKVLTMIEEYDPKREGLTADPDIEAKLPSVMNQVMYELARARKIRKYVEFPVSRGDVVDFDVLERECGYEVYQVSLFGGVNHMARAGGTVYKIMEDGVAEADLCVYPERITEKTKDSYEFELPADALEIMPYGVAADLLKSDVSAEYGNIYAQRYEAMLSRLDTRYQTDGIYISGGVTI